MSSKYLTFATILLITSISGCGIWWPIRTEIQPRKVDISDHVWECSEEDFRDLRRCFSEYTLRIKDYLSAHPEIDKAIAEKMRSAVVEIGMTEEQVLFMFEPDEIINEPNTKIIKFNDMGTSGNRPEEGGIIQIIITNGLVTKIKYFRSSYGL